MYIGLRVKCPLFLSGCNVTLIFWTDIREKYSYIKFHGNPFIWSRVVPCGQTDVHAWRSW